MPRSRRRTAADRPGRVMQLSGWLLIAGGLATLGGVGVRYADGWAARGEARARWEREAAAQLRLAADRRLDDSLAAVAPGTPVVRLVIPRIRLDEVVVSGVTEDELQATPGHVRETPLPGLPGNAVISAHRDLHFRRLGELRVGDTVTTVTAARTVRWRVAERRIVDQSLPSLVQTAEPALTLTTCWPIRYIGPAPDRLLLTAVPLDAETFDARTPDAGTPDPGVPPAAVPDRRPLVTSVAAPGRPEHRR